MLVAYSISILLFFPIKWNYNFVGSIHVLKRKNIPISHTPLQRGWLWDKEAKAMEVLGGFWRSSRKRDSNSAVIFVLCFSSSLLMPWEKGQKTADISALTHKSPSQLKQPDFSLHKKKQAFILFKSLLFEFSVLCSWTESLTEKPVLTQ